MDLRVHTEAAGGEFRILVLDPITATNCVQARDLLLKRLKSVTEEMVILDLQECSYVDTPGLSVLFDLKRGLEARGRSLVLQNPSRVVQRMLNITRMARVFAVRTTGTDHEIIPTARARKADVPGPAAESFRETSSAAGLSAAEQLAPQESKHRKETQEQ